MKTWPAEQMSAHRDDGVGRDVQADVALKRLSLRGLVIVRLIRSRFRLFFFGRRTLFASGSGFQCRCFGVDDQLVFLGRVFHCSEF